MPDRVLPNAANIPGGEFASGYNGSCGAYMTLGMLHVYNPAGFAMTGAVLANVVREAHSRFGAGANGTEAMGSAVKQLAAHNVAVTWVACKLDARGNALPLAIDWKNAIQQWAGIYPIGLELGNAQALRGDQVGLHFHFVLLVGLTATGNVLLVDGDTKTGTMLYEHTVAELAAAYPVAYVRGTTMPKGAAMATGVPTGWHDDGTTLTAPNSVAVTQGFRDYVLAHSWNATDTPFKPEYASGAGTRQDFRYSSLAWTQATNVTEIPIGDELVAAKAQIATLNAQIAALLAQEGTAPTPPTFTPAQQADLSMATALRSWVKGA